MKGKENGRTRFKRIISNILGKESTNSSNSCIFCNYIRLLSNLDYIL